MATRARRVDANQPEIVAALRSVGCDVLVVSDCSSLGFDVIARHRSTGRMWMIEIKDSAKPASKRKLTENEERAKTLFPEQWRMVSSVDDCIALVKSDMFAA